MIIACAQNGHPKEALHLFRRALSEEVNLDQSTRLLCFYSRSSLGSLEECKVTHKEALPLNATICAYAQNGRLKEAVHLFREALSEEVNLDRWTLLLCLSSCASLRSLEDGRAIHAVIASDQIKLDSPLKAALLDMYCKCGSLNEACVVFDGMHPWSVASWTSMIALHTRREQGKEALECFQRMGVYGVKPDRVTFLSVLDACGSLGSLDNGRAAHAQVLAYHLGSDLAVSSALISMYGKCGSLGDARKVFDGMGRRNVVSWTAMIAAYAQNGHSKEALELFRKMDLVGVKPNRVTFLSVLEACSGLASLDNGRAVHKRILADGLDSEVTVNNALVNMYGKCGSLREAQAVFDGMCQRDVISWNAMIAVLAQNGHGMKALRFYEQMELEGVKPDKFTFLSSLDACASLGLLLNGTAIHERILTSGFKADVAVENALLNMYGKCGSTKDARAVFEKMHRRNIISWTSMITAYAQNGLGKEALELFRRMCFEGIRPNKITFISVLDACASLSSLEMGRAIHKCIGASECLADVSVTNALVNMYGKCGRLMDARLVFDEMQRRNIISWNAMIAAYSQTGCCKEAFELFQLLESQNLKPDRITFLNIFNVCSHVGLQDEGWEYFVSMAGHYKVMPVAEHYVSLIDLLGRSGYLEEAEGVLDNMPIQADIVAWTTLLGACRVHGDVDRGLRAADHVIELGPKDAAPYVLLSNIYAVAGRWDDVAKVRKLMEERGVKKLPGCSWIEIGEAMHGFLVGDTSHPQWDEIHAKLQILSRQMKEAGYIPNTRAVLLDVEEEEKEHTLRYHSEKLAIAFGLISTSPGTPLQIVKNLRVCPDCHNATKFISKITGREITMRDANRFHFFKHGVCSCGDFW